MSVGASFPKRSRTSHVFEERAEEYDGWFHENPVYKAELMALQDLQTTLADPCLEIGVGPGHFARDLGINFGMDPAFAPLKIASRRGINVSRGMGEFLPFKSASLGTIYLLFTLCFVEDHKEVLAECHRVLVPGGHLVLGTVPLESPWGEKLDAKRRAGHPFYKDARFFELSTVLENVSMAGFELVEVRSTLLFPPDAKYEIGHSRSGFSENAGFVVLVGRKDTK